MIHTDHLSLWYVRVDPAPGWRAKYVRPSGVLCGLPSTETIT